MDWLSHRKNVKSRNRRKGFYKISPLPVFIWIILMSLPMLYLVFTRVCPNLSNILNDVETSRVFENISFFKILEERYIINTVGCKIPNLPVFSSDIANFFQYEFGGAHCNKDLPPLIQSNLTSLFLNRSVLSIYNVSNIDLFHCCYKELKRKIPINVPDNQYEFSSTCYKFKESVEVNKEFVKVRCDYENKKLYEDLFAFIPPKHNNSLPELYHKQFNVLIIGLDGISRLNFRRQMKETVNFLDELGFVEFLGYNKIADNTYPNIITVLTGQSEDGILKTCRNTSNYFDKCGFIWEKFKGNNYITSFAEDSAWMGMFNYYKYGFQKQPTDYMWGFFNRIAESLLGNEKVMNVIQCIGSREGYKMLVQYIFDFVTRMASWRVPYFAFFWSSSLSHDDINKPRIGDEIYRDLFESMHENNYLNNTIVIVMSDHGIRYGCFRQTYQGRMEERLPFLFIRLPDEFKEKYPLATSNLKQNSRVLTTHMDLHETLLDIASPKSLVDKFVQYGRRQSKTENGLSLFRKITPSRSCGDAGIPDHWCTCLHDSPIEINSKILKLAQFTVNYMNEMLSSYAQCENLRLKHISNAYLLHQKTEGTSENILINFQTVPGNGLFEATVRQVDEKTVEIIGSISRLDLYGKQSACISDVHLKLYCYCKNNV